MTNTAIKKPTKKLATQSKKQLKVVKKTLNKEIPTPKIVATRKPTARTAITKNLIQGKQIVCFWKQNDLALFGRRPDRWIQLWEQDPSISKVLIFEAPLSTPVLQEWLRRAITLESVNASEYQLLLDQAIGKLNGKYNTPKVIYKSYLPSLDKPTDKQHYLRWVLSQITEHAIENPTVFLWPACFANESLIKAIKPCKIITDIIDDQRLFPANAKLISAITAQYQTWLHISDVVISNSEKLIQSLSQEFNCKINYLPNEAIQVPEPKSNKNIIIGKQTNKRPIIGYIGNMRELIDVESLIEAIKQNIDKDFWFVGQTHMSVFFEKAKNLPNCKFWGTLREKDTEALVRQFNQGLIPFLGNTPPRSSSS